MYNISEWRALITINSLTKHLLNHGGHQEGEGNQGGRQKDEGEGRGGDDDGGGPGWTLLIKAVKSEVLTEGWNEVLSFLFCLLPSN